MIIRPHMPLSIEVAPIDKVFMQEAIKQAKVAFEKDEVPVGAIITHKNKIVAKAHNQVETLNDPTAHAEMIAITQATSTLSNKWLNDCIMYVTIEPCSMCAGALVLSRIKHIFFGAHDIKAGACGSCMNVLCNEKFNHRVTSTQGLLSNECGQLMIDFFQKKRRQKQS